MARRSTAAFATLIGLALLFQLNLFAQRARVNVSGSWQGGHYRLTQNGDAVTSDGDFGHANGSFSGPYTFTMSWASATWIATVSPDGNRISWNNNSTWSRDGGDSGTAQQAVWQIHAIWCTKDGGTSGIQYRASCTKKDQFNSILDCEKNNLGAQAAIRAAGPAAVNSFMETRKPGTCGPAPAPPAADYYVIWRYPCSYADGRSAGDCTINQHSRVSCQDAQNAILRRAQSSDVCKHCTANITDNSKQVSGAVQRITGGGPCAGQ